MSRKKEIKAIQSQILAVNAQTAILSEENNQALEKLFQSIPSEKEERLNAIGTFSEKAAQDHMQRMEFVSQEVKDFNDLSYEFRGLMRDITGSKC